MLARTVLLQLANNKTMEAFVKRNPLSGRMTKRFIVGESVEEILPAVREMNAQGAAVSLDFLGESVTTEAEVAETLDVYLRLLAAIKRDNLKSAISVKLTALGLDIDPDFCVRNMERLLAAAGKEIFVQMDMEGTSYTERTLDIVYRLWDAPNSLKNGGAVIQSYLYRSEKDIETLIEKGIRVRLCKGAYKEATDVAFPEKEKVDANYSLLMKRLLEHGNYPGIATHDPAIIAEAKRFVTEKGISKDRFEFQMLYGIRRDLQTELIKDGYNLTIYTPFGTHWFPYFMRRLAERPANLWFVAKNMLRG